MILTIILAPLTAAAFIHLPSCLPTRLLERVAVACLRLIANVAAVECVMQPRSDNVAAYDDEDLTWLPMPLVRFWTSPLSKGRFVCTYDQPGRWMSDEELESLRVMLQGVAVSSIRSVPTHRLFEGGKDTREVFRNRVVSVAFDSEGALGFTAMVYMECEGQVLVHLGLTMIGKRGRGQRLQSALFTKSLLMPVANLSRCSYFVTNCAASPAGIGNVSDYFLDCFPQYDGGVRKEWHVSIAKWVLERYRHEFGCSMYATFDPRTFVVYKSNAIEGGGTHQFIQEDGQAVSSHKEEMCNKFVASLIDFRAGDEIFQVARFHLIGSMVKYVSNRLGRTSAKK